MHSFQLLKVRTLLEQGNALYRGPAAEPFVPNMPDLPSASGANVASAFASVPLDDDEEQCW